MPGKLPWFKFYPDKWLSDERLRACSDGAKGLWIDMLCLMHKNVRRGYLQMDGKPYTLDQLSRCTGRPTDELSRQMQELLSSGVASATEHGVVYSRFMVSGEQKSAKCSVAGKRGVTLKGQCQGESQGGGQGLSTLSTLNVLEGKEEGAGETIGRFPDPLAGFSARVLAADPSLPQFFAEWCERHARRFGLIWPEYPATMADWFKSLRDYSEVELESASLALAELPTDKQPKKASQHRSELKRVIQAQRRSTVVPTVQADFKPGMPPRQFTDAIRKAGRT